jgi:hypothetical protein
MLAKDLNQRPVMAQVVDRLDELAESLRTGKPAVFNETEVFLKFDPAELAAPSIESLDRPRRPAGLWMFDRMPQPATPAPSAQSSVAQAAPSEARAIRWVTLALGLATAAFLLTVHFVADGNRATPALRAHTDVTTAPGAAVTTRETMIPTTKPMPLPSAPDSDGTIPGVLSARYTLIPLPAKPMPPPSAPARQRNRAQHLVHEPQPATVGE